jgi:hypothetical protein
MGSSVGTAVMWIPISTVVGTLAIDPSSSGPILGAAQKAALSGGLAQAFALGLGVSLLAFPLYLLFPGAKLRSTQVRPTGPDGEGT